MASFQNHSPSLPLSPAAPSSSTSSSSSALSSHGGGGGAGGGRVTTLDLDFHNHPHSSQSSARSAGAGNSGASASSAITLLVSSSNVSSSLFPSSFSPREEAGGGGGGGGSGGGDENADEDNSHEHTPLISEGLSSKSMGDATIRARKKLTLDSNSAAGGGSGSSSDSSSSSSTSSGSSSSSRLKLPDKQRKPISPPLFPSSSHPLSVDRSIDVIIPPSHASHSSHHHYQSTNSSGSSNDNNNNQHDKSSLNHPSSSEGHFLHSPRTLAVLDPESLANDRAVDDCCDKFCKLIDTLPLSLSSEQMRTLRFRMNKRLDQHVDDHTVDSVVHSAVIDAPITLSGLVKDVWGRVSWLAGLLLLQSSSSFILERFSKLIETHLVVTFFLTMLVGAGGNAGNQSAVMIIRGLATGTVRDDNKYKILWRQLITGFLMASILVCFGYFRVLLFGSDALSAVAISLSLFFIVVVSVIAGTLLPLGLHVGGIDPAHAGPTIQVIMDIVGVYITCVVCSAMFAASASMGGPVAVTAAPTVLPMPPELSALPASLNTQASVVGVHIAPIEPSNPAPDTSPFSPGGALSHTSPQLSSSFLSSALHSRVLPDKSTSSAQYVARGSASSSVSSHPSSTDYNNHNNHNNHNNNNNNNNNANTPKEASASASGGEMDRQEKRRRHSRLFDEANPADAGAAAAHATSDEIPTVRTLVSGHSRVPVAPATAATTNDHYLESSHDSAHEIKPPQLMTAFVRSSSPSVGMIKRDASAAAAFAAAAAAAHASSSLDLEPEMESAHSDDAENQSPALRFLQTSSAHHIGDATPLSTLSSSSASVLHDVVAASSVQAHPSAARAA